MLSYIADILIVYVINIMKLILVCRGMMGILFRKGAKVHILCGAGILALILTLGIFDRARAFWQGIPGLLALATIIVILRGKLIKRVWTALLAYICVQFLDICIAGVISILFGIPFDEMLEHGALNFTAESLSIMILGGIVLLMRIHLKHTNTVEIPKKIFTFLFAGAGTGIFLVTGLTAIEISGNMERMRGVMPVLTIIGCITYFTLCLLLVFLNESKNNYKMLTQINQTIIESQQSYYTLAGEKQREIYSLRHDMKNHLACINGLYRMGKQEELEEYLNQLVEETNRAGELLDCGNDIVNAIINDADCRYKKDGIFIRLDGRFPKTLHIASTDLCVIFANAVTNAAEAIRKIKKLPGGAYPINIKISSYKSDLYIDIQNPLSEDIMRQGGKPVTTKADKQRHGYGTKNMKQRVEKYQGSISFQEENGRFAVHIYMKNA